MSLRSIQERVQTNKYRLSRHALDECRARRIRLQDVKDAVSTGEVIETHVDDWGFDCFLVAGERFNGDVIQQFQL